MRNFVKFLAVLIILLTARGISQAENLSTNRIISLVPSHTELLYAISSGHEIVGVSDYCNYPPEVLNKPKIGGLQLNIEQILSLRPTLLLDLNSMNKRYEMIFRQLGLNYVNIEINKLSDIPAAAKRIAKILGYPKRSTKFLEEWNKKIVNLTANLPKKSPTIYLEIWDKPMQAAGPVSFMGRLLKAAGATNAIKQKTDYPVVNSEHIISANPDIILLAYPLPDLESVLSRPGWQNITAAKNKHIFSLNQDLFVRPGPRNLQGLENLKKIIEQCK
ncbi:MAG: ABC transporter substrate-binding protein [Candidatus Rifleibacteriota bacterium]